ncbi:MAG: methyltransferase [Gemmatimonadetes bacterium]|nr:methyltransferase [Gemmatimonadota bacterium]
MTRTSDRSTLSDQLRREIIDWPTEYHLSARRHCLVRGLGISSTDSVLELGCGCGAITRYLGELGATVVAVEGSLRRAEIASARVHGLPTVTVLAERLTELELDRQYDWVLLIGVLEYAPAFVRGPDPIQTYLECVKKHLRPGGKLVVAIENKLGTKYLNGIEEDHVSKRYWGVQGLYLPTQPRTFGRRELAQVLSDAGLPHQQFHCPFPDYKLPTLVISEHAMVEHRHEVINLFAELHGRGYATRARGEFCEPLVNREFLQNGILHELANSFLVVASADAWSGGAEDVLATHYSPDRSAAFATETVFRSTEGGLVVDKRRMRGETGRTCKTSQGNVNHVVGTVQFAHGESMWWGVARAAARGGELPELLDALGPWMDFLVGASTGDGRSLSTMALPASFVDVGLSNVLQGRDGATLIDTEWRAERPVPLGWALWRAIAVFQSRLGRPTRGRASAMRIARMLCEQRGIGTSRVEFVRYRRLEREFSGEVGVHGSRGVLVRRCRAGLIPRFLTLANLVSSLAMRYGLNSRAS